MIDNREPLVIWGASGHATVIADIVRLVGTYKVEGYLDDIALARHGQAFNGATVLGDRTRLQELRARNVHHLIVAIGANATRCRLAALAQRQGFILARAIHPAATIALDVSIGEGTVIAAGSVINPGAMIGANVIINTCASVDHGCIIEDGVHIGPGAHLGGTVVVRRGAWIGIGATLKDGITIGANSVLGAGAVAITDIPPHVVAYGVPAVARKSEASHAQ